MGRLALWLALPFGATALAGFFVIEGAERLALLAMLPCLLWASAADLVTREVPDWCPLGLAGIGLALLPWQAEPIWHVGTAAGALALLWGASELYFRAKGAEALGLGDVKLIAAGALIVGPVGLWLLLLTAPLGGIAFALASRSRTLPFAPFISYGLILALVGAAWLTGGQSG